MVNVWAQKQNKEKSENINRQAQAQSTHPISGVLRFRNPLSFLLMLFGCAPACCCCCACCFCCSKSSCSCCWLSNNCWNFRLPLLVSFSSVGSTNSSCDRLCLHQKYAAAKRMSSKTIMPSVVRTPINIMRPKSAVYDAKLGKWSW